MLQKWQKVLLNQGIYLCMFYFCILRKLGYMQKQSTLPDWALKFKQPGTEIRLINGKYYLYQISSQWDSTLQRAKKTTSAYLGRITQQGFKPKKVEAPIEADLQVNVRHFGTVHYFQHRCAAILRELDVFFPQWAQTLFVAAMFRLLYQSPLKKMRFFFLNSFTSVLWPDAHLSDKKLSQCLQQVGQMRNSILDFFARFYQGSRFLLIDGTHIPSRSAMDGLANPGYNSKKEFNPQVNALFIFAQDKQMPLYYRLLGGDIREVSSMILAVEESRLKEVILVSDKGFFSDANITALLEAKIHFAIPLKRNAQLIDYSIIRQGNKKNFHGYFLYDKRPIWYTAYRMRKAGRYCYVYTFLDESLYQEEQKDYLQRVQQGKEGYSMEQFHEQQYKFGTLSIIAYVPRGTNAKQVFEYFKTRNAVEQMIDVFKNTLQADRSYMRTEHHMEGWMFVNHLALMLYYQLYKELAGLNLLAKFSPLEVLQYLDRVYKVRVNGQWRTSEIPKKTKALLGKLGMPIP